ELCDALLKCYCAARALLPDDSNILRAGLRELRECRRALPKLPVLLRKSSAKKRLAGQAGYRGSQNGINSYTVKCQSFIDWFADQHQRELVMQHLIATKRMVLAQPKHSRGNAGRQPQEQ